MRFILRRTIPTIIYLLLHRRNVVVGDDKEEEEEAVPCIPPLEERPAPEEGVVDPYTCTSFVTGIVWPNKYEFDQYLDQYKKEGGRPDEYATIEQGRRGKKTSAVLRCYDPKYALEEKNKYITNNPCFVGVVGGLGLINTAMASEFIISRYDIDSLIVMGIGGSTTGYLSVAKDEDGNDDNNANANTNDDQKNCVCDVVVPDQWAVTDLQIDMPTGSTPNDPIPLDGIDYQKSPPAYPYHRGQNLTWIEPSHFIQGNGDVTKRFYWPADERLLKIAQEVGTKDKLIQCPSKCRNETILVGNTNGGSSNTFLANAEKAIWLLETYNISVVDMESAAAAQVAYTNGVPFLGIRGISDDGADDLVVAQEDSSSIDASAVSMQNAASILNGMLLRLCSDAAEFGNGTVSSVKSSSKTSAAVHPSTLAVVSLLAIAVTIMWFI